MCRMWIKKKTVHPHLRGEHQSLIPFNSVSTGSSPPAWGTSHKVCKRGIRQRFIPTCVGNIQKHFERLYQIPVHPHLRGEHIANITSTMTPAGSSPPAWGTCKVDKFSLSSHRFIPTCVGNIGTKQKVTETRFGSSPPAWGTLTEDGQNVQDLRFIPTCVGNIRNGWDSYYGQTVHPHLRGEHLNRLFDRNVEIGSSPPAWGT